MHREPQMHAVHPQTGRVPPAAVNTLHQCTVALLHDGQERAVCVRRDLVPGLILIGLVTQGAFAALTVDVADEPPLKLYELILGAWFPAPAELSAPTARQAALDVQSTLPVAHLVTLPPRPRRRARRG
ncbi:MAG: hypothetical protein HC794_09050 [Nitrospiraceae bacterium]|nr:hypothetical protein [Nitrospiraceae bacterium]